MVPLILIGPERRVGVAHVCAADFLPIASPRFLIYYSNKTKFSLVSKSTTYKQ